jgi:hypothetical protein
VTSWEVWFGDPKADYIVSLGMGRYKDGFFFKKKKKKQHDLKCKTVLLPNVLLHFQIACLKLAIFRSHFLHRKPKQTPSIVSRLLYDCYTIEMT